MFLFQRDTENNPSFNEPLASTREGYLASEEPHINYVFRSDDNLPLLDGIAQQLLATKSMKRLADIGFLGAIDYSRKGSGRSAYRRKHTRLEHSIGVAFLAQNYANIAGFSYKDRITLVAAALLHDVGHAPLSHSLEPIFNEYFGINHHQASRDYVLGNSPFGKEILLILRSNGLDADNILSLIEGKSGAAYDYIFSGPINIDTLEGITRCRAMAGPRPAFETAMSIITKWARSNIPPQQEFDDFWKLKHSVYAGIINSPMGLALDTISQSWMKMRINRIEKDSFFLTEKKFRELYPELFFFLKKVAFCEKDALKNLPSSWLGTTVQARRRQYYVDEPIQLLNSRELSYRYKQKKESWDISFECVLSQLIEGGIDECTDFQWQ